MNKNKGFSGPELLIMLAIIGLIAWIAVSNIESQERLRLAEQAVKVSEQGRGVYQFEVSGPATGADLKRAFDKFVDDHPELDLKRVTVYTVPAAPKKE